MKFYLLKCILGARGTVALLKECDINVVTGLLKLYLRELPEALFTDKLYASLIEGNSKTF